MTAKVTTVSIDELVPDPNNVRVHPERSNEALAKSMSAFGAARSVVVDGNGVVRAGNGSLAAARAAGMTEAVIVETDGKQLVVVKRPDWSDAEAIAYAIADNRTAELSHFDVEKLQGALLQIADGATGGAIEAVGFDAKELVGLFKHGELPGAAIAAHGRSAVVEDEIPEPPKVVVTKPGDVWRLGDHALVCGDSQDERHAAMLFTDRRADMVLTDPPYGVSYVGKTSDALTIQNDDLDEEALAAPVRSVFDVAERYSRPGAYWYATVPAGPLHLVFADDWKRRGILRQILVWAKDSMVLGHSEYHYQHEPILFGWVPGERHKNSDRTRTTVWDVPRPKRSEEHPTMKPVALWARAIEDGSRSGEKVFDPFAGSGTSIVAAEQLGRRCAAIELDPSFCDVIVERWQKLTGKKAERVRQ
jgi:site-specific DNA-methyltransferase (adenine-specific)